MALTKVFPRKRLTFVRPVRAPRRPATEMMEPHDVLIVDCDCHNHWCNATVLEPYLLGIWKDTFVEGEKTGPVGALPHGHRPWSISQNFSRRDVRSETGADNYAIMKEKHLNGRENHAL